MSEEMKPALTPDEWERFAADRPSLSVEKFRDLFIGRPTRNMSVRIRGDHVQLVEADECHALAALALHGQPFGFTHEDVYLLEDEARWYAERQLPDVKQAAALRSLAARIAALLPPTP